MHKQKIYNTPIIERAMCFYFIGRHALTSGVWRLSVSGDYMPLDDGNGIRFTVSHLEVNVV